MPGPARCRSATIFPSAVSSQSRKIAANFFAKRNLPLNSMATGTCAESIAMPMKTRNFGGGGGGGYSSQHRFAAHPPEMPPRAQCEAMAYTATKPLNLGNDGDKLCDAVG